LDRLANDGRIDAAGVRVSSEQLTRIREAAKDPEDPSSSLFKEANFAGATFVGTTQLAKATFEGTANFEKATFMGTAQLGPLRATEGLLLSGAVFLEHVALELRAGWLCAVATEFRSGADIRAVGTWCRPEEEVDPESDVVPESVKLNFERAIFEERSTVSTPRRDAGTDWLLTADCGGPTIASVVSLRRAHIRDLALSLVDLRECQFRDAQGLDAIRLEQVLFDYMKGWGWHNKWLPLRYSRRVAIEEEHRWRRKRQDPPAWWLRRHETDQASADAPTPDLPTPHQIVAVYRALRMGVEHRKDEPGAGDWYYGEMEMRRHATYSDPPVGSVTLDEAEKFDTTRRTPYGERIVLFLYWLTAGYGLRASRALVALAITIALGALLLGLFGFDADKDYDAGPLVFAAESSISLFRQPDTKGLTTPGHVVQLVLRLAGPLFFGLALLSLRGRVKR
jgi:hypothetical protein